MNACRGLTEVSDLVPAGTLEGLVRPSSAFGFSVELVGMVTDRESEVPVIGVSPSSDRHGGRHVVKRTPEVVEAITERRVKTERLADDTRSVEIFARSIRVGLGREKYRLGLDEGAEDSLELAQMFLGPSELVLGAVVVDHKSSLDGGTTYAATFGDAPLAARTCSTAGDQLSENRQVDVQL